MTEFHKGNNSSNSYIYCNHMQTYTIAQKYIFKVYNVVNMTGEAVKCSIDKQSKIYIHKGMETDDCSFTI